MSEQYIEELGKKKRISEPLISEIGKDRKSIFQSNAQASLLLSSSSPRPMESLNKYRVDNDRLMNRNMRHQNVMVCVHFHNIIKVKV